MYLSEQPPFLNAAVLGHTDLSPLQLLYHLKQIEKAAGEALRAAAAAAAAGSADAVVLCCDARGMRFCADVLHHVCALHVLRGGGPSLLQPANACAAYVCALDL
jgi:aspartate/glutamate racemase